MSTSSDNSIKKSICFECVVIIALLLVLCFVDIHALILKIPIYQQLKTNLDFLSNVISRYCGLAAVIVLLSFIIYALFHFKTNISEFSIAGLKFSLRKPEEIIKSRVRNLLNTKRSLFFFVDGYDNIYDLIVSWHNVLVFVREQLNTAEDGRELSKECMGELHTLITDLNLFLTKYQSDYRRWYEKKIAKDEFKPFSKIQNEYYLYNDITKDIKALNQKMRKHGDYFNVNYNNWLPMVSSLKILKKKTR